MVSIPVMLAPIIASSNARKSQIKLRKATPQFKKRNWTDIKVTVQKIGTKEKTSFINSRVQMQHPLKIGEVYKSNAFRKSPFDWGKDKVKVLKIKRYFKPLPYQKEEWGIF